MQRWRLNSYHSVYCRVCEGPSDWAKTDVLSRFPLGFGAKNGRIFSVDQAWKRTCISAPSIQNEVPIRGETCKGAIDVISITAVV